MCEYLGCEEKVEEKIKRDWIGIESVVLNVCKVHSKVLNSKTVLSFWTLDEKEGGEGEEVVEQDDQPQSKQ